MQLIKREFRVSIMVVPIRSGVGFLVGDKKLVSWMINLPVRFWIYVLSKLIPAGSCSLQTFSGKFVSSFRNSYISWTQPQHSKVSAKELLQVDSKPTQFVKSSVVWNSVPVVPCNESFESLKILWSIETWKNVKQASKFTFLNQYWLRSTIPKLKQCRLVFSSCYFHKWPFKLS